jgi:hypothetical protein
MIVVAVTFLSVAFASLQGNKTRGKTSARKRKKERKEGDCSRCCRLLRCALALQRSVARKKKRKKGDDSVAAHASVAFYAALHRSKKKEKGLPWSHVGPALAPSSKLWQLSSKLQAPQARPPSSSSLALNVFGALAME